MTEEEALKAAAAAVEAKAMLLGEIVRDGARWLNEGEQLCLEAPRVWIEILREKTAG